VSLDTITFSGTRNSFTNDWETVKYFTQGQCHALAWEIHKLTKWDLAILSDDLINTPDYAGHAFIVRPNGMAVDIRGVQFMWSFRKDWPSLKHLYVFRSAKEYKKEMTLWVSDIAYNRDPRAKDWAKYIVNSII
jgi:hypothetical protein